MVHSKKVLLFSLFFLLVFFSRAASAKADPPPVSYQVTVSATIGEPILTIFGYTSPQALVKLDGFRTADHVLSDTTGYFRFEKVYLPLADPNYPELCLTSVDTQSRLSNFPTCLPPLPGGRLDITVGPVLLPPTLSLSKGSILSSSKGNFLPSEQVIARGSTIPNAKVIVYLANDLGKKLALIRSAEAYSLPIYETIADGRGNFEFNLPADQPSLWRLFASAEFAGSPTPKSNTLVFRILNWWGWLWELVLTLFGLLKPFWWLLVIALQMAIIFFLLKKPGRKPVKAFALRVIEPKALLVVEKQ